MRGVTPVLAALARRFRLPRLPRNEAAPLALLLLALASVFAFGGDRSQFYRPGHHGNLSGQAIELAANLSAEHRFLRFTYRTLGEDGEPAYAVYHRFPIGAYALVKLAILPFGDDLPRQILAARLLMLAFYAAAAAVAYLALARLLGDRRIALTATLLAFSSYYLLYYNDMISAEIGPDLFGTMLVFRGMVVLAREGRWRPLLAGTAVALLLGWHVVALIAPFAALGAASEAARARGGGWRAALAAAVRSRRLAYGAASAAFAGLVLGWNLAGEYLVLGDLPALDSLLRRSAATAGPFDYVGWPALIEGQLGRIGVASLPYALFGRLGEGTPWLDPWPDPGLWPWLVGAGAASCAAATAGALVLRGGAPLAALALAGWCWAIAFRGNAAVHEYEAIFHVGIPLIALALALTGLRRLLGAERAALALPALAVLAAAAFVLSARDMGGVGLGGEAAREQRELIADFPAVRRATAGKSVVTTIAHRTFGGRFQARNHYYAEGYRQRVPIGSAREWENASKYDLLFARADLGSSLTPENRQVFVYDLGALPRRYAAIAAREPDVRSAFDVRVEDGALTWTRDACGAEDTAPRFFLHVVPLDAADLPAGRRGAGFEELGFAFGERGLRFGGRCLARLDLPDYAIAGVRTGQRHGAAGAIWEASVPVADASFPRAASGWEERFASAVAGEPALRARFDVRIEARTLVYAREDCAASDAEARFFLHVRPLDAGDLPEERRASGFDNLDFAFGERGVRYGGRCLASVALPEYGVASVRTGQFTPDGEIWAGEIAFGGGR